MSAREIKRRQRERRRRRQKRALYVTSLIVCVVVISLLLCGTSYKKDVPTYEYHTCDNLWEFLRFCPESIDRWDYIEEIMILNGMPDKAVYPDRLYQVPIYNK